MGKESLQIGRAFGETLRFACIKNKRGFQTKVGNLTGIEKANFSHILKGAGSSEERRRAILLVVLDLDPTFPARTYDDFLSLGQWLLDHDNDPTGWQPLTIIGMDTKILIQAMTYVSTMAKARNKIFDEKTKAELVSKIYKMIENGTFEKFDSLLQSVLGVLAPDYHFAQYEEIHG